MNDGELLLAWRQGDQESGEALFERYYDMVSRFFRNKVDDPSDLVQRTFLACVEASDRFSGSSSFRSFLFGIAMNQLRKHYRDHGRQRTEAHERSVADPMHSPSEVMVVREEQRLLLAALRRIPEQMQLMLELHYWEQMSVAELAEVLELPVGTVKSRMRRGRQLLEEAMAELATSEEMLRSTIDGLSRWAEELRQSLAQPRA